MEEEMDQKVIKKTIKRSFTEISILQNDKARANECINTVAYYRLSFSCSLPLEFFPPSTTFFGKGPSPPMCVFRHLKFCFDLRPAVFVAQVKHPCIPSGEPDPVCLGFVSAGLGNASDWQEALNKAKKENRCYKSFSTFKIGQRTSNGSMFTVSSQLFRLKFV